MNTEEGINQLQSESQPTCGELVNFCSVVQALLTRVETLEHLVMTDSLTGLRSHGYLIGWEEEGGRTRGELDRTIEIARRESSSFKLLMLDVNRFRDLNNIFGHSCGDEVLKEVARRLIKAVRKTDIVVRFGGDEFVVLAKNGGLAVARRICGNFSELFIWEGETIPLSVSVGVTSYVPEQFQPGQTLPSTEEVGNSLLKEADKMMYKAKNLDSTDTLPSRLCYVNKAGKPVMELFPPIKS